jgi:hypothetical protein
MRYAICLVVLAGCASSGVVPVGPDTYMLAKSVPAASGGEIVAALYMEANAYCAETKKKLVAVDSKSRDAGFGRLGNAEIQFKCVEK